MSKRTRQYIGLLAAVAAYYLIHEGAHLICALYMGVFKQINLMGLGIQIDLHQTMMNDTQMGVFCLVGALATWFTALLLVVFCAAICRSGNKQFKAVLYCITITMLLLDPLYLSILCGFFGGGDMNGISLLFHEIGARIGFGMLLLLNALTFWKVVPPRYTQSFEESNDSKNA